MRTFSATAILLAMFLTTTNAKAQTCEDYSGRNSLGTLTKQCLNEILISYVNYRPNGYFLIIASDEDNVYVQGRRQSGNQFVLEAVGPKYTQKITVKITQDLLELGWLPSLEDTGNYEQVVTVDQLFSNQATNILYDTLITYDEHYRGQNLTYSISEW